VKLRNGFVLVGALVVTACGGSDDGGNPPADDEGPTFITEPTDNDPTYDGELGGVTNAEVPESGVASCRGDGCPFGECGTFADEPSCSDVYPGPVSTTENLCSGADSVGYCLQIEEKFGSYGVRCVSGKPEIRFCHSECGTYGEKLISCG
jgi:hypothetical protein